MTEEISNEFLLSIIEEKLDAFGVPRRLLGYRYILSAVEKSLYDMNVLDGITKNLYPNMAKQFYTTYGAVERNIRTAIGCMCKNGNAKEIRKIMYYKRKGVHFTNKEFIFASVNEVK